ncbi:MAG TPA: hypothetical protein VJO32_11250, partial [Ktedonobacteraceae bacterium]|nr:hypothetical protein [Ktedonobacteraceae bacterium]
MMMYYKRKPEQTALQYRDRRSSSAYGRTNVGENRMESRQRNQAQGTRKRNVSTPEVIERPPTWSER